MADDLADRLGGDDFPASELATEEVGVESGARKRRQSASASCRPRHRARHAAGDPDWAGNPPAPPTPGTASRRARMKAIGFDGTQRQTSHTESNASGAAGQEEARRPPAHMPPPQQTAPAVRGEDLSDSRAAPWLPAAAAGPAESPSGSARRPCQKCRTGTTSRPSWRLRRQHQHLRTWRCPFALSSCADFATREQTELSWPQPQLS